MAIHDLMYDKVAISIHADSLAASGTETGGSVDTRGAKMAMAFFDYADSDTTLTALKVQESDDDSTWSDITGASFSGDDLPGATDDSNVWGGFLDLRNKKRYIRWVATASATGTAGEICAGFVLSRLDDAPVAAADYGFSGASFGLV